MIFYFLACAKIRFSTRSVIDLLVVQFLKQKMTVAGDAHFWQIEHSGKAVVRSVIFSALAFFPRYLS